MVLLGVFIFVAVICYFLVAAVDTPRNRAQEDAEQMEFLRRYNEKKKKRQG